VGGFNVVPACREVVFSKMYLGLDDGELVVEVAQAVILSMVTFDFGSGIPVVEVSNGAAEGVVGRGRSIE
jgi:hypothetical protein